MFPPSKNLEPLFIISRCILLFFTNKIIKELQLKIFNYFLIFFLVATQYFAQTEITGTGLHDNIADKIVQTALSEWTGYKWLGELCKIGPRLSGSENSVKAIKWAKSKLENLGADSVWLQPCKVPHWERGEEEKALLISDKLNLYKEIKVTALGGSIGTGGDKLIAEVVEVHNFDELKNLGDKIRDKIVFYNVPFDNTTINTFSAYGKAVKYRVYGVLEAAKFGAAGVIVRSVTSKYDNVPHTGVMLYADSLKKIPAVAIGLQDADFLSDIIELDKSVKVGLKLDCKNLPESTSYNVIGEIKGTEHPEEVIVVGGHLDSWDVGEGAHDDGAGVIHSLEVLSLFKRLGIRPKRTVRCVLFMNEENGSRGAKAYAALADTSREKHIAAIESDRGGFSPRGFSVKTDSLTLNTLRSWLPLLNKALIDWIKPGGTGADISKIKNAKALIGFVPDGQRYFDLHHSAHDTFDKVHPRELELGSAAITILTYLISEEGI